MKKNCLTNYFNWWWWYMIRNKQYLFISFKGKFCSRGFYITITWIKHEFNLNFMWKVCSKYFARIELQILSSFDILMCDFFSYPFILFFISICRSNNYILEFDHLQKWLVIIKYIYLIYIIIYYMKQTNLTLIEYKWNFIKKIDMKGHWGQNAF